MTTNTDNAPCGHPYEDSSGRRSVSCWICGAAYPSPAKTVPHITSVARYSSFWERQKDRIHYFVDGRHLIADPTGPTAPMHAVLAVHCPPLPPQ